MHDPDHATREFDRRFNRICQTRRDRRLDYQTIDHDFDRVLLVLVEFDVAVQIHRFAVDANPNEPFLLDFLEHLAMFPLATTH